MKAEKFIILLLVLIFVPGGLVYGKEMGSGDPLKIMAAADKSIDEGDLDGSIERLEGIKRDGLSDENLSMLHFLLGKAKYIKISGDIRSCRSDGTQKRDELQDYQVEPLVEALDHMKKSYDLSADSDWTPEALYAAGLIQDFSCLQRFDKAMGTYLILAEKYPDTNLGKAARQKYNFLKSLMDTKDHGQTHP